MSSRAGVAREKTIELIAIFRDTDGEYADPTDVKVSLYPAGSDPSDDAIPGDAWIYEASLTSGGTGDYADPTVLVIKLDTGKYRYILTVPSDAVFGTAFDNWTGTLNAEALDETFNFTIIGGSVVGETQLYNNNAVIIELKSTIAGSVSGGTLGSDYRWHFTTTYEPHYTSVRRVRLDLGHAIINVPDDTINLAIYEASLEANALVFGTLSPANWRYFRFARRMYATCLAEVILLGSLLGAGGGAKSKRLADLDVQYAGNLDDLINKSLACMAKYEDVLTSAGVLAPGTSQKPTMVIKGLNDPDRPVVGRGWEPTSSWAGTENSVPASNTKSRYDWKRRSQKDFQWPSRWNPLWRW